MGLPLHQADEIPLRGTAAVEAGLCTPEEAGMRYVKRRAYAMPSLLDQLGKRLATCKTEADVQALHLDWCRDKATKACASGTRRKATRMARARIDSIREERARAAASKPLIVAPW
jgi:hypothetical protein